jgi:outer membrane protein assembly factor BamB
MDYHHRGSDLSVSLPASYPLTIPSSFNCPARRTAKHQLNHVRVVFLAPRAARATLLAGLLALLWIASPQAWSQTIAWAFTNSNEAYSSPAVGVDGTIYFGTSDGRLNAVHSNGTPYWSYLTRGAVIASPALARDETVYVGSLDGWLYAVQADAGSASGKLLWSVPTGAAIYSSPAVGVDGTIYVGSLDHMLYAVRPNGTTNWTFPTGGAINSSPAVGVDGTIYVGSVDGKVYAISPNGTKKWEFRTGGEVDSSPAIGTDGAIYVGSLDSKVYAINPDGKTNWVFSADAPAPIYSSPAVGPDGTIYVAARNGRIYALRPGDGKKLWHAQATQNEIGYSSLALAADGTLYVGAKDGLLHGLATGGGSNWTFIAIGPVSRSSPTIGPDGTIYVGSDNHNLYALSGGSAPAAGPWPMFRRDARHTASGFVERSFSLPFYASGLGLVVSFTATPPPGVSFYKIEDIPPAGWTVGSISDHGVVAGGTVRFGPFFDDAPRRLSYQVLPPLNGFGQQTFEGVSFADGSARVLGGVQALNQVPLHPADIEQVDGWMTIGEVSTYLAAWKRGAAIPNDYLQRAIELWRSGEGYWYDARITTPPLWWTASVNPPSGILAPGPLPTGTVAPNGAAIASMPLVYRPGTRLTVTIAVTPDSSVVAHAVEDQPPAGWSVGAISDGGFRDAARGKIKWGPFADNQPRTLSYEVTPPLDATNLVRFNGSAAFDDEQGAVGGQRVVQSSGSAIPEVFAVRHLPSDYSPGATISVSIETTPLPGPVFWDVDETPPPGWTVSQISDNGYFDSGSGTIRFGPFFDAASRTLTYQVTSPLTETRVAQFAGTFEINFVPGWIAGDAVVGPIPLHPADQPLVDAWMTVGEVTAYGAAWKRSHAWPTGPSPILSPYLAQAIRLWQSGEAYRYDPSAGSAPYFWVTLPSGVTPRYPAPLPVTPGTSSALGTAICVMRPNVLPGTNLIVVLNVTPSTNAAVYAVEDQPPAGWAVSAITDGGFYDAKRGKVKWGPFFDTIPRPLSYSVAVPTNTTGAAQFSGAAAFDDTQGVITGVRAVFVGTEVSIGTFSVHRILPRGYVPGQPMQVTNVVYPPAGVDYVIVEDTVPAGWHVDRSRVSDLGVYSGDAELGFDHTVRYGVYLEGQSKALTYVVTPPTNSLGTVVFHGVALANETQIVFDDVLPLSPLHPGDANPTDNWITIGELTTYGAAWKSGEPWGLPPPPKPIQPEYLVRGIELWYGGEHYDLDVSIPSAPFWWVNLTNAVASDEVPIAIQPGSSTLNGIAVVSMTNSFQAGVPVTVTIVSKPNPSVLNYALEDKPPEGWKVVPNSISYGGAFDSLRGKVKWGPFFENTPRTNSYQVTPLDLDTNAVVEFKGGAAFDGQTADFIGDRFASPNLTNFFAVRHLPKNYSPGLKMTVILDVNPPPGVSFYKIEDTVPGSVPEGWIVTDISHDGVADLSGVVRFGPFLDDAPRRLRYDLTPPLCGSGTKTFTGIAFADGSQRRLVGDYLIDMSPLHPAEIASVDGWVTIGEVTAYVAAWKVGAIWPCVGPDSDGQVRNDFLESAVELWLGGEHYGFDPTFTNAPQWWVNTPAEPTEQSPVALPTDAVAGNGAALASMPLVYQPGTKLSVTIGVTPDSSVVALAVEDQPPAGWSVGAISDGGFLDVVRGKVKWGPFSDSNPRTLSYEVTPPAGATNTVRFNGATAFDNQQGAIGGQRFVSPKLTDFFAVRHVPSSYSPGLRMTVILDVNSSAGVSFYKLEDTVPAGWTVSNISHDGVEALGVVRFGPFLDDAPRVLTYDVTPPLCGSGTKTFAGIAFADGSQRLLVGDYPLDMVPLHPAEIGPVDGWMTIGEVTAYVAAWKDGATWACIGADPPDLVRNDFLERAVELWQSGEAYRYDPTAGPAPSSWVPLPAGVTPPYPAPLPATAGTSSPLGTAVCIMPSNVLPGTNLTVVLKVTASPGAAAFAVEDQPPAGWAVSNISDGGFYDAKRGKVKWGPFSDTNPRTLSYSVAVPANLTGVAQFSGAAAFDDTQSRITGVRALFVGTEVSNGTFYVRHVLPRGYVPGRPMTNYIEVFPLADVDYVIVEDTVPAGWHVDGFSVSDRGVYSGDAEPFGFDHTVRYGVYLDGQERTLYYVVRPPTNSLSTVVFHGVALANETQIVFDDVLPLSPLHPGDANPTDNRITIGELTTYGAAWKHGDPWGLPPPPKPIQPEYMVRAVELWYGGEYYDLDVSITNAPFWWVNTSSVVPGVVPLAIEPGSSTFNGTAVVSMTDSFQPGVPITVTITSTPASFVLNYALEDQPPEGWTVLTNSISYGGSFDALRGKVKWGPFFENTPRTNSYQVMPPFNAGESGRFLGGAAFDGQTADFIGPREIVPSGNPLPRPQFSSVRVLPGGLELTVQGGAGGIFTIQRSTDLIVWDPVGTLPASGAPVVFLDSSATNRIRSFYRVVWQ